MSSGGPDKARPPLRHRHGRVEHVDLSETRRGTSVADHAYLAGLSLAVDKRSVHLIGRASAEPVARAPEVSRARLVRDIAQHAGDLAVADFPERLAAELEVVALLIDRPA